MRPKPENKRGAIRSLAKNLRKCLLDGCDDWDVSADLRNGTVTPVETKNKTEA